MFSLRVCLCVFSKLRNIANILDLFKNLSLFYVRNEYSLRFFFGEQIPEILKNQLENLLHTFGNVQVLY